MTLNFLNGKKVRMVLFSARTIIFLMYPLGVIYSKNQLAFRKIKTLLLLQTLTTRLNRSETPLEDDTIALLRTEKNSEREIIRNLNFDPLPGTRKEAEQLKNILEEEENILYKNWLVPKPEKNLFHQIAKPPHILHFATHGFFVNNREKLDGKRGRSAF